MKNSLKTLVTALAAFAAGAAVIYYFVKLQPKAGGDQGDEGPSTSPVQIKQAADGATIVMLDAATRQRLGLKTAAIIPDEWQPGLHAVGRTADSFAFAAAAADYESVRSAAQASQSELERTRKLAEQGNASPRTLETAQAAAAHDALALDAARAKFAADWGFKLAARTNLTVYAGQLQTDDITLVKLSPPPGTFPDSAPAIAAVFVLGDEAGPVAADFADDLGIDPATQTETFLFSVNRRLPPNISVTAELRNGGPPLKGICIPDSAVLRYEGRGWVYVQTGANDFTRVEIPLDHPKDGGWFIPGASMAQPVIVAGAQTVLSAELSGGNFNSGSRD